jgi:hypothetical protein
MLGRVIRFLVCNTATATFSSGHVTQGWPDVCFSERKGIRETCNNLRKIEASL